VATPPDAARHRSPLSALARALLIALGAWAVVWAAHYPLLHLPYFWDEAGYYIPAAYDFFRSGSLIPYSTLSNAHPPLPSLVLAGAWKLFGFHPFVTRTTACLASALALVAVWRLALAVGCRQSVAIASALLTGLYPVFFAQSSLAHADIFAAPFTLWALVFYVEKRRWPTVICFALGALAKETAIATPAALAAWELWLLWRSRPNDSLRRTHLRWGVLLLLPALPLAGWYAYHHAMTGFTFGNPQFLRYNATSTLQPARIAIALFHRTLQLTLHMNLFVPFLLMIASLWLPAVADEPGGSRPRIAWSDQAVFYVVIAANGVFFSLFGGALLTRYLLPVYPLVLILCVNTFWRRMRNWEYAVALSAIAFAIGLFVNPPYQFAPEDNLEYATFIHLQQNAIDQIEAHYASANVLTAWPASDELRKPELGYVTHPVTVTPIEDFDAGQIARAAHEESRYDVALVFSTKYDPQHLALRLGPWNTAINRRYFDFHRDLDPETIARILHGKIEWQQQSKGLWAAVISFNHPEWARLRAPEPVRTRPLRRGSL
jgi:4-amino-4-deoxy-L-arabinose transferase-like glycosyltransferase